MVKVKVGLFQRSGPHRGKAKGSTLTPNFARCLMNLPGSLEKRISVTNSPGHKESH